MKSLGLTQQPCSDAAVTFGRWDTNACQLLSQLDKCAIRWPPHCPLNWNWTGVDTLQNRVIDLSFEAVHCYNSESLKLHLKQLCWKLNLKGDGHCNHNKKSRTTPPHAYEVSEVSLSKLHPDSRSAVCSSVETQTHVGTLGHGACKPSRADNKIYMEATTRIKEDFITNTEGGVLIAQISRTWFKYTQCCWLMLYFDVNPFVWHAVNYTQYVSIILDIFTALLQNNY